MVYKTKEQLYVEIYNYFIGYNRFFSWLIK